MNMSRIKVKRPNILVIHRIVKLFLKQKLVDSKGPNDVAKSNSPSRATLFFFSLSIKSRFLSGGKAFHHFLKVLPNKIAATFDRGLRIIMKRGGSARLVAVT
jgi:hypothetical protein